MNALGKYCHDFPRLAKESGYNFRLHRGKINWNDLDTLNIQEIIEERNFRLLEENLIHVINCNLEREYDVKILDQNFVKLFKLAQLGIDYLSYCELYLDKCVILLQEQLFSRQEECSILKEEIEKKNEELTKEKNKRKMKVQRQNVKCNKCQKIFLNEIYLESHEKRRHKNVVESDNSKNCFPIYTDQIKQTEETIKFTSVSTQTTEERISIPKNDIISFNGNEINKINEQEQKIEHLKRDLEELKLRLSLAEKTIEEKKNVMKSFQNSYDLPSSVTPIIHSCFSPNSKEYLKVNPRVLTSIHNQASNSPQDFSIENQRETKISRLISVLDTSDILTHNDAKVKQFTPNKISISEIISSMKKTEAQNNNSCIVSLTDDSLDACVGKETEKVNFRTESFQAADKFTEENKIHLNDQKNSKISSGIQDNTENIEDNTNDISKLLSSNDPRGEQESFNANLYSSNNTNLSNVKTAGMNSINEAESTKHLISCDSSISESEVVKNESDEIFPTVLSYLDREEKSKSLLRKMTIKTPKIQEMTFNLKNSFSQLYGSVSSIGKKSSDLHETDLKLHSKSNIIEGLNTRLRDLGIDPEWTGIPKETMKEKLNVLEHNRNLLSKENRLYPFFRRKLKKHILKKLRNNSISSKKKAQTADESSELIASGRTKNDKLPEKDVPESNEIKICDSDRDSENEIFNLIKDKFKLTSPDNGCISENTESDNGETGISHNRNAHVNKETEEEMETDFTIFQAGKYKEKVKEMKAQSNIKNRITVDELQTESDFDEEFFKEFEEQSFESIKNHMTDKGGSPKKSIIASFPVKSDFTDDDEFSSFRNYRFQNQSILKDEGKPKSEFLLKKKVIFAEPEIFDTVVKSANSHLKTSMISKMYDSSILDDNDNWSLEND